MRYIALVLVLAVGVSNFHGDVHWGPWFSVQLIIFFFLAKEIWQKIHPLWGVFSFWTLYSSLSIYGYWFNRYQNNDAVLRMALDKLSIEAAVTFICLVWLFLNMKRSTWKHVMNAIVIVGVLNGVYYLFESYMGMSEKTNLQGFFGNTAQSAAVVALVTPFFFNWNRWAWIVLTAFAFAVAYVAQSSMAYLTLTAAIGSMIFARLPNLARWACVIPMTLAIFVLGRLFDYQFLMFHKLDRLKFWPIVLKWWIDHKMLFIGAGNGTTWMLGPIIQKSGGMPVDQGFWVWFHNDWLQVLFEQGVIGFILALLAALLTAYRAFKTKQHALFAAIIAYCVYCFGMYPTNIAFTGLIGFAIVRGVFYDTVEECDSKNRT